jgi:putative colanic acid biosynthesis UDP-glucose lipid carrier transferase
MINIIGMGGMERVGSFSSMNRIGSTSADIVTRVPARGDRSAEILKRTLDIVGAGGLLLALAPLLIVIAIAVRLTSRGPALFRQRRHGEGGRVFRILKFRTMSVMEDGDVVVQSGPKDTRVTRIGALLRLTAFDELPQLINVLKGDMSLVGPRPQAVPHNQAFERLIPAYGRRHLVRPGITGWAQVNGHRGPTTLDSMRERLELDIYYVEHRSFALDLRILFLTLLLPITKAPARLWRRQRPTLS